MFHEFRSEQNNKNSNRIVYRNIEIQSLFYKVLDVLVQLLDWSFHILLNRLLVDHSRIVLGNEIVGPTFITKGENRHTRASSKEHGNNGLHASRDERQPCCWLTVWELLPMQHKLVIPNKSRVIIQALQMELEEQMCSNPFLSCTMRWRI